MIFTILFRILKTAMAEAITAVAATRMIRRFVDTFFENIIFTGILSLSR